MNKYNLDCTIKAQIRMLEYKQKSDLTEMDNWFIKNSLISYETLIRMKLEGYTVKKEQLYNVIVCEKYLVKKSITATYSDLLNEEELVDWIPSAYQLTEQEIKAIDERYMAFAVKVDDEDD